MSYTKRRVQKQKPRTLFSSLLSAWGKSLLLTLPLLFLFAALAYRSIDPRAGLSAYATVTLVALSLSSGFFAARSYEKSGALLGFLAGFGISLLLFGLGLLFSDRGTAMAPRIISLLVILPLGIFGGLLGTKKRVRRRRPR